MPKPTKRTTAKTAKRNGDRRRSPEIHPGKRGVEVQRFGALRLAPIAFSAEARGESAQLLNIILADSMILYAMYKKHHWLVAGPTFYQLHLLFDKHAEAQQELIDLLAEPVQTLGAIDRTDKNADWGSNDLLMSDVLRRNELQVWFISSH